MSHMKIYKLIAIAAMSAMLTGQAGYGFAAPTVTSPPAAAPSRPDIAPAAPTPTITTPPTDITPEAGPGLVTVPTIDMPPLPQPIKINEEPSGPAQTMTLDQVIAAVVGANPTVQLAQQQIVATSDAIGEITSQKNFQVHLDGAITVTNYKSFAPTQIAITPVNVTGGQIPTVMDSSAGTLFSAGSTGSGGTSGISAGTTTTTGAGSSTTGTTSTTTIVPVSPVPSGTSSTTPSSGSSSSTSGNAPTSGGAAAPQVERLNPHQTGTGTGTTTTGAETFSGGSYYQYGADLEATKLFDVYGLVSQSEAIQRETVNFYKIDLDRMINELTLTTKNVFFSALRAQANIAASQEQVTNAQATLHDTTVMFNAGTVAHYDVISAQTQLVGAEQNLVAAQNNFDVQMETLNNLMHVPIDTKITLTQPPLPTLPASYDGPAEVSRAYAARPEIRQANLNIDIAKRIEHLNSDGLLPTFGVGLTADFAGPATEQSGGPPVDAGITAGVSWPLWDGGETKARVAVAKDNIKTQQISLDQLQQNVDLEVRSALTDVVDAAVLVNATQQAVTLDTEALRLARVRYRAGAGTLLEVTNAQATLATDQFNLSSAQFQLQTAAASLQRAEGGR